MAEGFRRSSLALAVLGLLEVRPLHPYGIARLIKDWGKDAVINVGQRANLYKTITRLADAGYITATATGRDQNYPERTTYEITDEGRRQATAWLADMLASPRNEFADFPAALSFAPMIDSDATRDLLVRRREALAAQADELSRSLAAARKQHLPRAVVLDSEFQRAVVRAEITWLTGVLKDLDAGTLSWTRDQLQDLAAQESAAASD